MPVRGYPETSFGGMVVNKVPNQEKARAGRLHSIGLGFFIVLLASGCASTIRKASIATDRPFNEYREAYGVYPAVAGNGISRHLVRSHTTAILVRPLSSAFELGSRLWDRVWDTGRRLEIRFVRFPVLNRSPVPSLIATEEGMDMAEWEAYLDWLTGVPASTARVEFLIGGEAFYSRLYHEIDGAVETIDLQTYLFDNDDVAIGVAERLRDRSEEIEVRVMYDGLGTYLSHMATAETQPADYEPVKSMPRYLCRNSNIRLRVIPNTWLSGSHVKSMIFDRRRAFIGGMNLGREYRYEWHDMMILLEGEMVNRLSYEFDFNWRHNGWGGDFGMLLPRRFEARDFDEEGVPVRLLYTLPAKAQIYRSQLEAIRRSRRYIYIENAYFADDRILYELCKARKRGVDVRIIVPAVVNHNVMARSNRVAINTMLENGIRVFMYPNMSHVKAAVYDGWACVGTANFDKLSLQINRELNLATSHPPTVQQLLDQLFVPDFEQSEEVTEPVILRVRDHFIELIADET